MFKTFEVTIVQCVRSDEWSSDVVIVNAACRWCAEGVVYWLEQAVGDVQKEWYTGWNKL
jgi:hypothetical protein